ncbi:MAG: substrate-binding domain-containing protein [Polyangiaceae bacterium]
MSFRTIRAVPTISLLLAMAACSSTDSDSGDKTPVKIAWIAKGQANTFFDVSRVGAKLAAEELSASSGREVTANTEMDPDSADATLLPDLQVEQLQKAIDEKYDAINVSVLDPVKAKPVIDAAVDAGIPVLTFDSDAPDTKRLSFYGMDNLAGAKLLATTLADLMGGSGTVAIMTAKSTSSTYADRIDGFNEIMANFPNIKVLPDIVYCTKTEEASMHGCVDQLEQTQAAHPEITAWYLARGRVFREKDIFTLAPTWGGLVKDGSLKVVGFDAPEDAIPAITQGVAQMVIGAKQFAWGYDLVNITFDVVTAGRKLEAFTDSTYDVICENNWDQLAANWTAKDFRQSLPKCSLLP